MMLAKPFISFFICVFLLQVTTVCAQVIIDKDRIILDMYSKITQVDTIVEEGSYGLAAMHPSEIRKISIWKNNTPLANLNWKDQNALPLYRGVRSRLVDMSLDYKQNTVYSIEVCLEGETEMRHYRIQTRHPSTKKPHRSELGTPICNTCPPISKENKSKQLKND